ncbi:hypothetical protein BDY19DRAFT_996406 [Irpex rosettiformis]|uniref:Uncharacterized protein n=1 Tax=Irpex rosettiformis TaxID=378272 RepID=A0ACB8TVL7_9APHY|nr:hypothetical protein BDY19DRAFT_996406 [Irpex rosettiformis]
MTEEDLEVAEDFIEDCNTHGRLHGLKPKERNKIAKLVRGMERTLHRIYGAHALVLVGFRDKIGVGCLSYERQPAQVEQYSNQAGFTSLKDGFSEYCQSLLKQNESTFTRMSRNKVHRSDPHETDGLKWRIPTDKQGWGHVITHFPDRMLLSDMKDVMRAFWTNRYRMATGNKNAKVPFGEILKHPGRFFNKKFMPPDVFFNDPSRLSKAELLSIVNHWEKRLACNKVAFFFHGARKDDSLGRTVSDIPIVCAGTEKRAEFTSFTVVDEEEEEGDQIMSKEVPDSDDEFEQPTKASVPLAGTSRDVTMTFENDSPSRIREASVPAPASKLHKPTPRKIHKPATSEIGASSSLSSTSELPKTHMSAAPDIGPSPAPAPALQPRQTDTSATPGVEPFSSPAPTLKPNSMHSSTPIDPNDCMLANANGPAGELPCNVSPQYRLDWLKSLFANNTHWATLVEYVYETLEDGPHPADAVVHANNYNYNVPVL